MSILTIRANTRYALRQDVRLEWAGGNSATGLLIELSAEGCRISGLADLKPDLECPVDVTTEGMTLHCQVRWTRDGVVGLRMIRPLATAELAEMLARTRGPVEVRRYGT